MPWRVVKAGNKCPASKPFAVVNSDDGELRGCHPSKPSAIQQLRALYKNVPEGRHKATQEWQDFLDHLAELAKEEE